MELADIGLAPRRREKVGTLREAVGLIKNGDMLAFGGIHSHNGPMALIHEMIRQGIKDLHAIGNVSAGMPADILIGGGCVDTFTVCYVGLEHLGFAPRFRQVAEQKKIKIIEGDEIYYILGLKAGAVGLPFVPHLPGHEARDGPKVESTYARFLHLISSSRTRSNSSCDRFSTLKKSSFQPGSSLQRSGNCTVVRGAGALSSRRSTSSSAAACEVGSSGRPAGQPSGKSQNRKRGTPQYSTMSLAQPMTMVGMPFSSR
ncbi:MAG: hypothetical protein CMM08_14760 [Rhodospirillaceae bacterium]|nr:hypothetical protein [Rhodospirillaceae bacterium]